MHKFLPTVACRKKFAEPPHTPALALRKYRIMFRTPPHSPDTPTLTYFAAGIALDPCTTLAGIYSDIGYSRMNVIRIPDANVKNPITYSSS